MTTFKADIAIAGGGLGGVAAALASVSRGHSVILIEESEWLGGQLTSQGVPPDEHPWVEQLGVTSSYRALRNQIRAYYRHHYPLTRAAAASPTLNPGAGTVSKLCHEPRVAAAVIDQLLAPWRSSGRLTVVQPGRIVDGVHSGDRVEALMVEDHQAGQSMEVEASYYLDATETGDLLPLVDAEYVVGAEAQSETDEEHAPDRPDPSNMQAITHAFAIEIADGDHTISRPELYSHWRDYQPSFWGAPLLSWTSPDPRTLQPVQRSFVPNPDDDPLNVNADQSRSSGDGDLWLFRRMLARLLFEDGLYESDICLVNWASIDYFEAPIIDVDDADREERLHRAKQLSLSMLYWMQTEAPRHDGGTGFPELRLRPDVMGTADGLAKTPYIRESRRIRALSTVTESDVSRRERGKAGIREHEDSVGVGMYRIDLHPSTGDDNYIDIPAVPFEIPLRALIPQRLRNLLPASKNIGTTHITNGCYRLHPVEWNIGEAAGSLASFCMERGTEPHAVTASEELLQVLQKELVASGVELHWPHNGRFDGY